MRGNLVLMCWQKFTTRELTLAQQACTYTHNPTPGSSEGNWIIDAFELDEDEGEEEEARQQFRRFHTTGSCYGVWAPRRSEAGLILLVPHSLANNPVFRSIQSGRGVKYRCAQRAGSTRQYCAQFYSTVARHCLYE